MHRADREEIVSVAQNVKSDLVEPFTGLENLFPEIRSQVFLRGSTGRQGAYKMEGLSRSGLKK